MISQNVLPLPPGTTSQRGTTARSRAAPTTLPPGKQRGKARDYDDDDDYDEYFEPVDDKLLESDLSFYVGSNAQAPAETAADKRHDRTRQKSQV